MRWYVTYDVRDTDAAGMPTHEWSSECRRWFQSERAARRFVRQRGYEPDKWVTAQAIFGQIRYVRCHVEGREA